GMGWFPGYAINLETGERLNIMFGEDSWWSGENGRDMQFNPTANELSFPKLEVMFGGKHYVYVMGRTAIKDTYAGGTTIKYNFPAYDAGKALAYSIDTIRKIYEPIYLPYIYTSAMWVGIPLADPDVPWLSNEVKIKIRIAKPYENYFAGPLTKSGSQNNHYPMYQFSTGGLATTEYNNEKALSDLDYIRVVPNPYYAYSQYELVPLDNRVKVTNLPEKCTVSIYDISGILIRKFTKDDPITYIDWDLKNQAGIPIAGGVYIVHVKDEITKEERIVKWFGSLRIEDFKQF
ncbi:MAG: T9SS type A sorting domain-containing protein, partial [Bacteroidetes bacterium]|nr:T9SS type A sorting domain-containing protein [Bacteroidota bacterium]